MAQFGGPTPVINRTLIGIVKALKEKGVEALGPNSGIPGIMRNDFYNLSLYSDYHLDRISKKPGAELGTTKYHVDEQNALLIVDRLKQENIRYFYMIGGDSTASIAKNILKAAKALKPEYELTVVHVPKTIDNDLVETDHCPGFGSGAMFLAFSAFGIDQENRSTGGIFLHVSMGRDAGYLAAASTLLRSQDGGPHLVYMPEKNFVLENFLKDVDDVLSTRGRAYVVVSEGLRYKWFDNHGKSESRLVSDAAAEELRESVEAEKELGGISTSEGSKVLARYLDMKLKNAFPKQRVRADTLGYLSRSFPLPSPVDAREAEFVGREAVYYSLNGNGSGSVVIRRLGERHAYAITTDYVDINLVAGQSKSMPLDWIGKYGKNVSQDFMLYAGPLIGHVEGFDLPHLLPGGFDLNKFCIPRTEATVTWDSVVDLIY